MYQTDNDAMNDSLICSMVFLIYSDTRCVQGSWFSHTKILERRRATDDTAVKLG